MRIRSQPGEHESTDGRTAEGRTPSRSRTGARRVLLLVAGIAAVAYLVSRYVSEPSVPSIDEVRDRTPSAEEVREGTVDAVSGDFRPIPIGDRGEEREESDEGAAGSESTEDVVDVIDSETNVDITEAERSAEEIAERADEDVPEPGEMAVDEEVADELVDEDILEEEDEDGAETDENEEDADRDRTGE